MQASTNFDFERRFGGLARLYGAQGLARFQAAHVAVVGVGGVGSWVAEALARSAIGRITLIDMDHVSESNTNRQIHALDGEYGKAKVLAMQARIAAINPAAQVTVIDDFITPDNVAQHLAHTLPQPLDWVLDCIDQVKAKVALIAYCRAQGIELVTCGSAGGKLDASQIRLDDLAQTIQDPLLAKVRQRLRKDHGFPLAGKKMRVAAVYSTEAMRYPTPETMSCHPVDASAGLNCAGFGSATHVTATVGLLAVSHCLLGLARAS